MVAYVDRLLTMRLVLGLDACRLLTTVKVEIDDNFLVISRLYIAKVASTQLIFTHAYDYSNKKTTSRKLTRLSPGKAMFTNHPNVNVFSELFDGKTRKSFF